MSSFEGLKGRLPKEVCELDELYEEAGMLYGTELFREENKSAHPRKKIAIIIIFFIFTSSI